METRRLGNSDLDLTVIGLGTWAIGGGDWAYGWGPQEEKDSIASILEALELGINWIDTAAVYGLGKSEEMVAKALKEWGKPVIVATKCGLAGEGKKITPRLTKESIRKECEASLKRLNQECIDLYQIHWPNPPADIGVAWETLQELKQQGKIRWAGVSNFSAAQLEAVSPAGHITSLQPPYSMVKRDIEADILPWCRGHQCGVIAYSPMQAGLLTGKVTHEWVASLPQNDWRKKGSVYLKEPRLSALIQLVSELQEIAAEQGHAVSELAVAWVLSRPGVTAAIVGARRAGQISNVIGAASWHISEADMLRIEAACTRYEAAAQQ